MTIVMRKSERAETTIQSVVLVPVVFLITFMCFHVGSFFHQRHIAEVAAIRGATVASGLGISSLSANQARIEIERVVADLGSHLVSEPSVSYENRGVQVTVNLKASSVLSFLPSVASAEVWQPLELFRSQTER